AKKLTCIKHTLKYNLILFECSTISTVFLCGMYIFSVLVPVLPIYFINQDANSNRIGQWLNQTSNGKILQLSYSLNSEAREGSYSVIVSIGESKLYHSFKVEKYVLPKFDVKIDSSDESNIEQEEIKAEVCAKYTYGQPVPGSVNVKVCRPLQHYFYGTPVITTEHPEGVPEFISPCYKETKQVCVLARFDVSFLKSYCCAVNLNNVAHSCSIEASFTGISHPREKRITISYVVGKLSFIDTPKIYDRGSNVEGKVKAVYYNNTPIPDMPVYLFESNLWSSRRLQNLRTNSDGVATFSFSTADFNGDIHLHVSNKPTREYYRTTYRTAYYQDADHKLSLAQPPSLHTKTVSSLEVKKKDTPLPCDSDENISIRYTVVGEAQGSVDVMYLVLSRGAIVTQGLKQVKVPDKSVNEGEVSFKLKVSAEIAPEVQIVAYTILPSETVIAHSADFSTEKCFSHKVLLEFSPSSAVPGEETTLQVTAQPDSLCGVSAVDQSVLIKEPGKTLETAKIFGLLPVRKATSIPHDIQEPVECLHVWMRPRRYVLPYPYHVEKDDAHTVFQNVGLKMATNLFIRVPSCLKFKGREYHQGHYGGSDGRGGSGFSPQLPPIETVRTFFPETWIWDLVEVGASSSILSATGIFQCYHHHCLLTVVFIIIIITVYIPHSVLHHHHHCLYSSQWSSSSSSLSIFLTVTVTPTPSLDYTLTPLSGDQYTSCLCGNERKTLSWTMAPSALGVMNVSVRAEALASQASCDNEIVSVPDRGRIDVVTRSLIVKAEGTEMTKTYNWLLCPKGQYGLHQGCCYRLGGRKQTYNSLTTWLLRMPYGCGEQNMALLAPNIYILQYLKNTQQLTPAIKEKATNFLTSGYQRQLNYKHQDGAYSTFGSGPGNTWLTAFVLRSFAKAQSFIYIDPTNIEESKTWLKRKQRENGCFEQSGKLFNNRMKGGVSDEVTLSAYITAGFLEMNMTVKDPVVNQSLSCLKESISDLSNTYTTALLAYVFTLAGDMETRAHLLKHLDTVALNQGGFLHWSQTATETSASLSVEISSYVLLAKLSASPTAEDLGYAARIIRWITGQQNYYGGFSSTQALALYSSLVFSPGGSSTVTVQSPSGQLTFDVYQDNKLLYQEEVLKDMTGKYSLVVQGNACASVQISIHYNIPTPTDVTTLSVEVKPEANCTGKSQRPKLTLKLKYLYSGKENTTNMVILDIILSGFVPDPESLKRLNMVSSQFVTDGVVLFFFQQLPKDIPINHNLELIQELPVQNLKPAVVKIYDYYQPSKTLSPFTDHSTH
uniref:Alpha-2-macroglobulin n=1 Tax=Dicentrarchus labrax TaxID=13489 RepID=A0A8P4KGZ8_DICLA